MRISKKKQAAIRFLRTLRTADVNTTAAIKAASVVGIELAQSIVFGPSIRGGPKCDALYRAVPGCAGVRG